MKFDELLYSHLGEWGRYQKTQLLLVCIPAMMTAMHALSWTFTSMKVPHRCILPGENESTPFDISHVSGLGNLTLNPEKLECVRYGNTPFEEYFSGRNLSEIKEESCVEGYKWDHSIVYKSAIDEFEIVCDNKWIRAVIQSLYYVGQFLGSFVFGILGDKIGRKKVFFIAIISQMVCGTVMAFVPHWIPFALLRIGVGFCHPGIFVIAVVIGMELVGPSKRALAGVITGAFYAIGQMILGGVAYFLRNYQWIQIAISAPDIIFLAYWWLVPESARWLMSKKRILEADAVLQKAAKTNGVTLPDKWYEEVELDTGKEKEEKAEEEEARNLSYLDLFRYPNLRFRTIIMYLCWPVVSGVYYGLSMNPTFLGGDPYIVFIVAAFMEIPGLFIVFLTINRWGRKILCSGGFFLTSLCLFSTLVIPPEIEWLKAVQVVASKMTITSVYATLYTFTPELFPTPIRNTALGSCSMVARVGAVSSSYVSMWLVEYSKVAVILLFAAFTLGACVASLFLPETVGIPLPETINDVESAPRRMIPPCLQRKRESSRKGDVELDQLKPSTA